MAIALGLTVVAGAVTRAHSIGVELYDKSLGNVLYASAAYLALALVWSTRKVVVAAVALAWCWGVELFKRTGFPERHADFLPSRLVLGSTFEWVNVGWYLLGVAAACVVDRLWLRPGLMIRSEPSR